MGSHVCIWKFRIHFCWKLYFFFFSFFVKVNDDLFFPVKWGSRDHAFVKFLPEVPSTPTIGFGHTHQATPAKTWTRQHWCWQPSTFTHQWPYSGSVTTEIIQDIHGWHPRWLPCQVSRTDCKMIVQLLYFLFTIFLGLWFSCQIYFA